MELVLTGKAAKQNYISLEKRREEIEKAIKPPIKWYNPEEKTACRIYTRTNANFSDRKLWPQQHEWLREKLEASHKVVAPIVKTLD